MKILGYHISGNTIVNSDGETATRNYLSFLTSKEPFTIRLFYDMDSCVFNLMRLLNWGNGQAKTLLETTRLYVVPYHFRYIPGKLFSIKKHKTFAYYGNAGKYLYTIEWEDTKTSAEIAQATGEIIYQTLAELGVNAINILNPYKQYNDQVLKLSSEPIEKHLEKLKAKSAKSYGISRAVIDEIIAGITASAIDK
jgi:hypothetical protein